MVVLVVVVIMMVMVVVMNGGEGRVVNKTPWSTGEEHFLSPGKGREKLHKADVI